MRTVINCAKNRNAALKMTVIALIKSAGKPKNPAFCNILIVVTETPIVSTIQINMDIVLMKYVASASFE